ncbi:MAG: hypothetical protein CL608_22830 [Anaerolineaceae bacterium]|nr:hypothetical protein [Anaerolineaceae bacterium]
MFRQMTKRKGFTLALALSQAALIFSLLFWLLLQPTAVHAADLNVNTFIDASDGSCLDATCSLRDAIATANPADTIYLPAGSYLLSSGLGEINIAKTITIIGQGGTVTDTIIDGNNAIRLFTISSGTVTFSNLTLQNGNPASGNGGAILTSGTGSGTLDNSIIRNSVTQGNGGGIYLAGGTLNILNGSQIRGNTAVASTTGSGGGVYSSQGTVNLSDSLVANNSAQFGGGIRLNQAAAQLTIDNSQILNNSGTAPGNTNPFSGGGINSGAGSVIMNSGLISGNDAFRGGGALVSAGAFTLNGGTITDNESNYGGGAYVVGQDALLTINNGTISGNRSVATIFGGGGLYIFQGRVVQNGGEISGNTAVKFGGAMEVRMGSFEMNGGVISGNSANDEGGAIYNDQGTITITNGTLTGNSSLMGGGAIAAQAASHNTISHSVFYSNSADQNGGAILNSGTLTLTSVTLSDNEASSGGGLQNQGTATLTNATVYENTAAANGGGLNGSSGTLNVVNTILAGNSAASGPDCAGTIVSQGYNLIQNSTGCTVSGSTTGNLDGDPLLAALALNGGSTLNHAIDTSSPALDAGDNASCASTDQRGVARPIDGDEDSTATCDIGAFELGASLTIDDVTISEGNSGSKIATFTVTLAPVSPGPVTVNYATADGTAVLADNDYMNKSGQLTFNPGDTEEIIEITINGDDKDEWDETFLVNLSNANNATISDGQGVGTISNDDTAPSLSIADTGVTEGSGGTTTATFTVTLSAESGKTVTVNYATGNDTAVAPTDFLSDSNTLTFNPGETEKIIEITVNGDLADEDEETFQVNLSNASNATINGSGQAIGTISDDDDPPNVSIGDVVVTEGNSGTTDATFTVSLDQASGKPITVTYTTQADSAAVGSDYTMSSGTLIFAPDDSQKTITVLVTGDPVDEDDEHFFVNLTGATNATLADDQGQATISDDDAPPTISMADVTVSEGAGTAVFTVNLSHPSSKIVTVDVQSGGGSATGGEDYTAVPLITLTFIPGEPLSQTVNVTITDDDTSESSETFLLNLSNPGNATLGSSSATGTITDDDGNFVYIPFVITP